MDGRQDGRRRKEERKNKGQREGEGGEKQEEGKRGGGRACASLTGFMEVNSALFVLTMVRALAFLSRVVCLQVSWSFLSLVLMLH